MKPVLSISGSMMTPQRGRYFQSMMIQLQKRFAALFCYIPKKTYVEYGSFCEYLYSLDSFIQGLTLDEKGRFSGEAEKKLEEVNMLSFTF